MSIEAFIWGFCLLFLSPLVLPLLIILGALMWVTGHGRGGA